MAIKVFGSETTENALTTQRYGAVRFTAPQEPLLSITIPIKMKQAKTRSDDYVGLMFMKEGTTNYLKSGRVQIPEGQNRYELTLPLTGVDIVPGERYEFWVHYDGYEGLSINSAVIHWYSNTAEEADPDTVTLTNNFSSSWNASPNLEMYFWYETDSPTPEPSTSPMKRWDGSAWVTSNAQRWDGSNWVPAQVNRQGQENRP